MKEELIYVPREYKEILEIFSARLKMKHLLKGTSHREMKPVHLLLIASDEFKEMADEIDKKHETRTIEEALDLMICGLIIADRVIQGDAFE